jgi:hypothetical protein
LFAFFGRAEVLAAVLFTASMLTAASQTLLELTFPADYADFH